MKNVLKSSHFLSKKVSREFSLSEKVAARSFSKYGDLPRVVNRVENAREV